MNEQAIQDSYNVFVSQGYTKSIDEFKKLINTNPQALKDSYDVFVNNGYSKSIDDYKALMGVSSKPAPVSKKKVSSESVAPQKPQTPTTESLSEDGLSVTPVIDKSRFSLTQEDLKKIGKKQPTDMSGKPLLPKPAESQATFNRIEEERAEKRAQEKKYGEIFDKQVGAKPKPAESSYLKERLKSIDTDLINYEQDYIVPELEYQFGDLGFKFEESGIIGDYVKVTAPNNKTIEISADNLFSSKSKEQAEVLKKFIAENTPAKGLFVIENTMREQDVKFNSQKQVDESIKSITNDVNLLSQKQKEILERKTKLDKDIEDFNLNPTQEGLNILQQQKAQLDEDVKKVLQEESSIQSKGLRLNQAVAKYGMSKARQGSWYGGIWDSFNRGVGKMTSGVSSLVIDTMIELLPENKAVNPNDLRNYTKDIAKKLGLNPLSETQTVEEWKNSLTEDQKDEYEDAFDDILKKETKQKILPYVRIGAEEIFGDPSTTKQWADLKKEGFWGGAILGVAESLPAMIGGGNVAGWAQRTAQMYAQISDGLSEEMENDPDFKNITENEKLAITLPIGITSAVLEAYGLRNVMASKGVINSIALRAMGKAGVGTSAKTFRELVQNEVDGMVAKGLLTITAAGVAEFETGAAQELTETGYKIIYDKLKEKDMFNTPDSKLDLVENVLVAGAQEAVGGFLLGIPSGVSVAYSKKGFLAMDDTTFETFASMANDTNIQSAYIASLKQKITQGLITQKEAKEQLNDYRNSVGLYRQLPEGLTTQQKKEAMNLLKEKRDLENFVEGKDNALVVKQKSRIEEINNALTTLGEQPSAEYIINDKQYTKEEFLNQLKDKTQEELKAMKIVVNNDQETMSSINEKFKTDAIQEQSTTEIPVQSETGISETMEGRTPEAEPQVITEQVEQEEEVTPSITIAEAIDDRTGLYVYDGKKGAITTIGQTVVLETDDEIIDLGNVEELSDSTLDDFGIIRAEDIILNDDNSVSIGEKKYVNNYSNPESAISQDKDGNYSVTLDTENGQKRTFRGQQAEQIAYQMKLKNFEQNGTEQDIDTAIELADEAIRIEEETREPSTEREGKTVRKGKRKQRTLKTVKEPLTKAEREASIAEDIPPPPVGYDIVTEQVPAAEKRVAELEKEKADIEEQLNIYKQFPQPKAKLKAEKRLSEIEKELKTVSPKKEIKGDSSTTNNFDDIVRSENKAIGGEMVEFSFKGSDGNTHEVKMFVDDDKGYAGLTQVDGSSGSRFKNEAEDYYRKLKQQKVDSETTDAETKGKLQRGIIKEIENDLETNERSYKQRDENISVEFFESLSGGSLTRKQIDAEIAKIPRYKAELKAEYDAKKAELEKQLKEARAKLNPAETKTKPATVETSEKSSKLDSEIETTKKDVDFYEMKIEDIQQEIKDETQNTKEEIADLKQKIEEVKKDTSLSRAEKKEAVEDLKEEIENVKENQENVINDLKDDLKEAKSEYKKALSKIDKLLAKKRSISTETKAEVVPEAKGEVAPILDSKVYYQGIPEGSNYMQAILNDKGEVLFQGSLEGVEKFKRDNKIPAEKVDMIDLNLNNPDSLISKILREKNKSIEVKDLLKLDTKDKTNLEKVSDYLEKLDRALDLDPNELNDVTRVMAVTTAKAVVKTLKALVNAGITLQKAIEMASEAHKVKPEEIIDALDIVSKINENKSEGISEMELPGYNKLSKVIDSAIKAGKTIDNILSYMERSEVYKNATDVQKELLVREVRKKFGLREKSAPSVGKLFGKIKDIKKITMTEKDALIKQLKDTAKGARQSIQEWKKQTQSLAKDLAELKKSGKITVSQETAILNKFAKVNIFSEKSVSRFTDYMTKVFADADYKAKLSTARKTLASIKKLAKNKEKNADLRAVASEFVKIDPSLVDNIDEYNIIAKKIKEAIEGSKIRKADTKIAETINIENTAVYIEKALAKQEVKLREEKINELQDLLDVDASTFSAEEIDNLLDIYGEEKSSSVIKDNEKIIRAAVKKAFDIYSTVIKEMLSTGVDPFTGEDVEFTDSQRKIIKEFMGIDLNTVSDNKDALRIVDSLINFIQNKSTAGMSKSIADYQAIVGGNELIRQKIEGKGIRKLWSKSIGKTLAEQFTSLNLLFEKEFKGFNVASKVRKMMGITDLVNGKSIGQSQSNQIVKKYVEQFYNKTANGEAFNSAYNDIERGVFAHVYRNVIGTEQRKKAVFEKRKQEVLEAADFLENDGNERERQLGELYRKAYNKILDGSENINDVKQKTDINNVDGVNYWVNEWANKFDALSDLALNFYNKILSRDLSYTPDRVRSLEGETKEVDLENNESAFISNTDGPLYNKKSSSLMDKQENRKIPKGMYIDLSFDSKNSNSMYDAMIDLNTAFGIRKVQSFLNSENFKKIFKDDADLFKKRISNYVRLSRRKSPYTGSELSKLIQKLDKIATIGVTQALASPTQPFKQTIPVAASTLINAGSLGMGAAFNPSYNNWLDKLGYAVSNRGIESRAEIESINRLLEKAASSKKEKAGRFIREANEKMLKWTLVNFDVWIARASFKAYYEQYLKKEGLYDDIPKKQRLGVTEIDYENHEPNDDAADYAQEMIDRQQNISDHDLAGDLFTDKNSVTKAFIKMLMAFSSFRMNQGSRLGADLTTLEYWNTSTKEDKIIALRSIAGYTAEQAVFRGLQITFGMMFYYAAKAIMGKGEDDEEDEKFKNNLIKSSATGMITDTFSPLPLLDPYIQNLTAAGVDVIEDIANIPEEDKTKLFEANKQEAIKALGVYGIVPERAGQVWDLGKLAYSRKFKDNYGTEKEISQEDADALKVLIGPYIASLVTGVLAPDVSSLVRKSAKIAEKRAKSIKEPVTVLQEEGADVEKELTADQEIEKAIKEAEEELSK